MTNTNAKRLVQIFELFLCAMLAFSASASNVEDPPLFDMAELKSGMRGVGYTVFSSLEGLESFEFEVLGIMRNHLGPGEDLIIARLIGKRFEKSGVVAGMSGSPAYIGDQLLGAVGYGFGEFTLDAIAGITPIKSMLKASSGQVRTPSKGAATYPLALPLVMQGLSAQVADYFEPLLKSRGYGKLMPSAASAGGAKEAPKHFYPGGPIAAMIVEGDLNLSAIGTVTWVKGDQFLAFGHPFMQSGKSELPVANAEIVTTVFSPQFAYKMGQPTTTIGRLTDDRLSAIAGSMSKVARTTPFKLKVEGASWNFKVARHPKDTPLFAAIALASVLNGRTNRELGGTYRLSMKARLSTGHQVSLIRETASMGEALEMPLALAFLDMLNTLTNQSFTDATLEEVELNIERQEKVKLVALEALRIDERLYPGARAKARVSLRPWQAKSKEQVIDIQLPLGLNRGTYQLVAADRTSALVTEASGGLLKSPQNYDMLIAQIRSFPKDTEVCLYLEEAQLSRTLSGYSLTGLPASLRSLTAGVALAPGATAAKKAYRLGCLDAGGVVSGSLVDEVQIGQAPNR